MNRRYMVVFFKHAVYVVLIILLHVLQSTPSFLSIMDIKPILVIPFVVCIAMFDEEFIGGLYGTFAGLLYGLNSTMVFGYHAMIWLLCCVAVGMVVIYLMRRTLLNSIVLSFAVCTISGLLEFLFQYGIWGYSGCGWILLKETLPTIVYSTLFAPLFFIIVKKLKLFFDSKLEQGFSLS